MKQTVFLAIFCVIGVTLAQGYGSEGDFNHGDLIRVIESINSKLNALEEKVSKLDVFEEKVSALDVKVTKLEANKGAQPGNFMIYTLKLFSE